MSAPAFAAPSAVPVRPVAAPALACTFAARPTLAAVRPRRAARTVMSTSPEDYKIQESEFVDPNTDDDSGDGFIGEAAMDDMLGVSMPEDLPGFEIREIEATRTRDELVGKLREIANRRKDIIDDRRKGIGMDNVGNYLDKL